MTITEEWIIGCILLGIACLFTSMVLGSEVAIMGILLLVLAFLLIVSSGRYVPANPPTIAISTFWGKRQPRVLKERFAFVSRAFPFFEDLIFIGITRQARTILLKGMRCRPILAKSKKKKGNMIGGSVEVEIGIVFQVDIDRPESVIEYLNAGGQGSPRLKLHNDNVEIDHEAEEKNEHDAVWRQLIILITGAVRLEAGKHSWIELTKAKPELSAKLVSKLTGQMPLMRVLRNEHGIPIPNLDPHIVDEYLLELAPIDYVFTEEDYVAFLYGINVNGAKDVRGLGIVIRSITVEMVEPEGELKKDAEQADREAAQREGELADFETEDMLISRMITRSKKMGAPMTVKEARENVRIDRGRAQEFIVRVPGGDAGLAAAALYTNKGSNGKNTTKPPEKT